jgi:hypothetical protein
MKWFFLFFLRGIAMGGPYDTEKACLAALKVELERPVNDQGFDGARPFGLCFQGSRPDHG